MSGKTNHSELIFESIANSDAFNPDRALKEESYRHCDDEIDFDAYETNLNERYRELKTAIKKDINAEIQPFPEYSDPFRYEDCYFDHDDYDTMHSFGEDSFVFIAEMQARRAKKQSMRAAYNRYLEKYQKQVKQRGQDLGMVNLIKKNSHDARVDDFAVSDSTDDASDDSDGGDNDAGAGRRRSGEANWAIFERAQVFARDLVNYQSMPGFDSAILRQLLRMRDGRIVMIKAVERAPEPYRAFEHTVHKVFVAEGLRDGNKCTYPASDFSNDRFTHADFARLRDFIPTAKELRARIDAMAQLQHPVHDQEMEKEESYQKAITGEIRAVQYLEKVRQEQMDILKGMESDLQDAGSDDGTLAESIEKQKERVLIISKLISERSSLLRDPAPVARAPSEEDIRKLELEKKITELSKSLKKKKRHEAPQSTISLEEQRGLINFSESESSESEGADDIM